MTPRRRNALIFAGVAAAAAGAGYFAGPGFIDRIDDGPNALHATVFADLEGKPRKLAEWQGKILILNFWASWCAPCLEEIPILIAVRSAYAHLGVEIVGIAIDVPAKIVEFSKRLTITYPILVADTGGLELMRLLGNAAAALPYTVFLDRESKPVKRKLGALKRPEVEAVLSGMLKK